MRIITCPVFAWLLDDDYNMASRSLLHCFCRARDWIILAAQETEWFCDFKDNFFFQIYKIHYAVNLLITLAVPLFVRVGDTSAVLFRRLARPVGRRN